MGSWTINIWFLFILVLFSGLNTAFATKDRVRKTVEHVRLRRQYRVSKQAYERHYHHYWGERRG